MGVKLANNAVSTIVGAVSSSDTGITVASGTGSLFPILGTGDYFYATLVSTGGTYEVIKVTARVGDAMTIVRAQEGTIAQSFASGSRIELRVTAASIVDMVDEHDQASEISFVPTGAISSTNVQDAVAYLTTPYGAAAVGFTPAGGISATNTQSALVELDTEKTAAATLAGTGGAALVGTAGGITVQHVLDGLAVRLLDYIPQNEHAGLFNGGYTYDCGPAFNAAMTDLNARGSGTIFVPGGAKLGIGTTVVHLNGVAVVNESPASRTVLYMQDGANIRMWESLNYDLVKAGSSNAILYEGGLSGLFFVGNKANNASGSGMFMAESGFTYDNVWFDDFGLEGFERRGTRVVNTNFPQTPYRRRVETLVKDMSVTRCGGASNYAFDLGGPDDLEAFGILLGGNPGKVRIAVESQRFYSVHAYSNGEAVANDYGVEIDKGAYIFGLEVRDNYYGGVKITANASFTRIFGFQGQKNGRNTLADTERHVLIEGTDCYIDGRIQSADDNLSPSTNGTQPGIELATGADRATLKLNISGNNSGSNRNMTRGCIIGDVDDYDVDLTINHINGPAVQLNTTADPQRRGKLVARVLNAASVLEKNTTVPGGEITIVDRGSNTAVYTGTSNVALTEKWDVRTASGTGSRSHAAVYSADLAADALASGTAVIPHGLLTHGSLTVQPDYARITAEVVRPSTGTLPDDVIVDLKVKNRDATNVEVRWTVTTASATAGSKFRIAVQARLGL